MSPIVRTNSTKLSNKLKTTFAHDNAKVFQQMVRQCKQTYTSECDVRRGVVVVRLTSACTPHTHTPYRRGWYAGQHNRQTHTRTTVAAWSGAMKLDDRTEREGSVDGNAKEKDNNIGEAIVAQIRLLRPSDSARCNRTRGVYIIIHTVNERSVPSLFRGLRFVRLPYSRFTSVGPVGFWISGQTFEFHKSFWPDTKVPKYSATLK